MAGGGGPVTAYANDAVVLMPPDATLAAVVTELADDQIGVIVIGTHDAVMGVISERDVVRAVAEGRDLTATQARDIATTALVWCDHRATVHVAAELMMEQYVRHVLLEEHGNLVAIVSARDLLGAYTMGDD